MSKLKKILFTAILTLFLAGLNITFVSGNVGMQFNTSALANMSISCSGCIDCLGSNCGGDRSYCGLLYNTNTKEYVSCDFDNQ